VCTAVKAFWRNNTIPFVLERDATNTKHASEPVTRGARGDPNPNTTTRHSCISRVNKRVLFPIIHISQITSALTIETLLGSTQLYISNTSQPPQLRNTSTSTSDH
jgi:hypothetical protein